MLPPVIDHRGSDAFLSIHHPYQFAPVRNYSMVFQLIPDGIHHPVSHDSRMQMRLRCIIGLVEDGTQIKVAFQGTEGMFNLADTVMGTSKNPIFLDSIFLCSYFLRISG